MQALHRHGPLVGRILIALIFVLSGFSKIGAFAATSGYIASKGLPVPDLVTILTIVVELGGGLLIMVGYRARLAAAALFLLPWQQLSCFMISGQQAQTWRKTR